MSKSPVTIERVEKWDQGYNGDAVRLTLSNGKVIVERDTKHESDSASVLLHLCEQLELPIVELAGEPEQTE